MPKFKALRGTANNLADSFISNWSFFNEIESYTRSLPSDKTENIEIDLLNEDIKPEELKQKFQTIIRDYKDWFLAEIKKFKIEPHDIEKVFLKFSFKFGYLKRDSTCNVSILTKKGKVYSGRARSHDVFF